MEQQKSHLPLLIVTILVVILAGAGFGYAYFEKKGVIKSIFNKAPETIPTQSVLDGIKNIKKAGYKIDIDIATEPRRAGAQPTKSSNNSMEKYFSNLPEGFALNIDLTGASQKIDEEVINTKLKIAAKAMMQGSTMELDAEIRKIGEMYYLYLSKFPPLVDTREFVNKWISISGDQAGSLVVKNQNKDLEGQAMKVAQITLALAEKHKVIETKKLKDTGTVDGKTAYKYSVDLNEETLAPFYKELTIELVKINPDYEKFDENTYKYLSSPAFKESMKYFEEYSTFTMLLDKDNILLGSGFELIYIPHNPNMKDKQVKLSININLTDINKDVVIDIPSGSVPMQTLLNSPAKKPAK